jgi:hypothetical protein
MREWLRCNKMKIARYFVGFMLLWNIGILQSMYGDAKKGELPAAVKMDRLRILQNFIDVRSSAATLKSMNGVPYAPEDYFRDMHDIMAIQSTLGVSVPIQTYMNDLLAIMHRSMGEHFTMDDLVEARMRYVEVERLEAEQYKEVQGKTKQFSWIGLFLYFVWLYLKNFLPVLLLYLIWMKESEDERRIRLFPNPLHLAWRIIAHPYYLAKVFWGWFVCRGEFINEWLIEAEYRRTKEKLFVYLTESERQRIKNFAKGGLPVSIWRSMLRLKGLNPAHSLAAALAVTLIFSVLPRTAEAKTKQIKDYDPISFSRQVISNHLPRMAIEDGKKNLKVWGDIGDGKVFCEEAFDFRYNPLVSRLIIHEILFYFQEVWRKIFHIPLIRLFSSVLGQYQYVMSE